MEYILTQSFVAPLPSRATRKPPARSKASTRGLIPAKTKSDPRLRTHYTESTKEQDSFFIFLSRYDVLDIWEQPTPVAYHDDTGRLRKHVFDFRVTLTDGRKLAIAVKPHVLVERYNFRHTLSLIRVATPLSFADEVVLVTERSYTPSAARNARKLHDFRRTPDEEADRTIASLAAKLTGPVTISTLIESSGLGGRAFRAAFRGLYEGWLLPIDIGDILPTTRVVAGGAL